VAQERDLCPCHRSIAQTIRREGPGKSIAAISVATEAPTHRVSAPLGCGGGRRAKWFRTRPSIQDERIRIQHRSVPFRAVGHAIRLNRSLNWPARDSAASGLGSRPRLFAAADVSAKRLSVVTLHN
jgi:hypothetical protein